MTLVLQVVVVMAALGAVAFADGVFGKVSSTPSGDGERRSDRPSHPERETRPRAQPGHP